VQNPILTFFKIAAFTVLAFLVWITFWQGLRAEDRIENLIKRTSALQEEARNERVSSREYTDSVKELSGKVDVLVDLIARGAVAPRAPAGEGSAGPTPPPTRAAGAPAYFSDRAKALWGRFPDYLLPDPDRLAYPDQNTAGVDTGGRLTAWYGGMPSDINPITTSDGRVTTLIEEYVLRYLCDRHRSDADKFRSEVAIRAEHNENFTEWVLWLRDDVLWHPAQLDLDEYPHLRGRHYVTAHDVKFRLDMILNPEVNAAHDRAYFTECAGAEVVDDFCVIIRWNKPQYQSIAFTLMLKPVPRHVLAYDESGEAYDEGELPQRINDHWFYRGQNYMGCGPYYVDEMDLTDHILLRRFEDFYGPKPPLKEIWRNIFDRRDIDVVKLEKGEHDYASVVPDVWDKLVNRSDDMTSTFKDGRIVEAWGWTTSYSFIGWKCSHPIFKDVKVRTAMAMACNRPRNSKYYPPDLEPLPFDLDGAAALLAEAGWRDADNNGVLEKTIDGVERAFAFKAILPSNPRFLAMFEIFKEDLLKIGVKMQIDTLAWKQFKQQVIDARDFECTALLWSGDGWESDLTQIFHSCQIAEVLSSNFCEFGDPLADQLMEELRLEFDIDERVRKQRILHKRIAELQPYVFLTTIRMPVMYWKDRLGNVEVGMRYVTRPFVRTYPWYRFEPR